jgi:hypothetical protein
MPDASDEQTWWSNLFTGGADPGLEIPDGVWESVMTVGPNRRRRNLRRHGGAGTTRNGQGGDGPRGVAAFQVVRDGKA